MEKLLQYILGGICENPESITIEKHEDEDFVTFVVIAPEEEIGKIIGRGGRNIKAMQSLLSVPAKRENKRISIKVEPTEKI